MKTTNLIRVAICLTLLIILFATPAPAKACLCGEPSPASAFIDAEAVFAGKVVVVSANYSPVNSFLNRMLARLKLRPIYFYSNPPGHVTFEVRKSWKNVSTTSVTVSTGMGSDCSFDSFNFGDDYLVYANQWNSGSGLDVNRCSRTTKLSHATEDLTYLSTLPTLPLIPVYDYSWTYYVGAALFLVIAPLLTIITLVRRRQQPQTAGDNS
jgi:hypothetical protein